ncbi:putative PYRUVATE, PHOSPHATE DIKINASE PPDK domain protein [Mycobacterium ulcerans str. Harvey]|uniref:PYRUVATE, PHOSPHATE DIKINASE PPDK domain protein n=1 Tax=Mycobacterium ulcerans str. Harvey TaxID=1299332 RepID=A0ABN0R810_MYCUL|nr:putative PYRUVATE, PHOSPHATE DIKINASE PPDK domain protein [Mycobacterium ulcerans str. Harvey]
MGVRYLADPAPTLDAIWDDVVDRIRWLEAETGRTFGSGRIRCWSVCAREPTSRCPA